MNREQFMRFFRQDDFHSHISASDAQEIFLNVLHGSSDITIDLIEELKSNYGIKGE